MICVMNKDISAVLIPCLLLQLFGCYSYRIMTTEELKDYKGQNDIKIWTNQSEVLINRKANKDSTMNWEATDSSIIVKTQKSLSLDEFNELSEKEFEQLKAQYLEIKFNEIDNVKIDKLNGINTALFITAMLIVSTIVIYLVLGKKFYSTPDFFN